MSSKREKIWINFTRIIIFKEPYLSLTTNSNYFVSTTLPNFNTRKKKREFISMYNRQLDQQSRNSLQFNKFEMVGRCLERVATLGRPIMRPKVGIKLLERPSGVLSDLTYQVCDRLTCFIIELHDNVSCTHTNVVYRAL